MSADANNKIDAARIDLALGELRLPGVKRVWAALAAAKVRKGLPSRGQRGGARNCPSRLNRRS